MIAELWPDDARGKGAGLMQCGLGIGFFLASLVWLFVGAARAGRLALHVPDRRPAGAADAVDPALDPRIAALGARRRAAPRGARARKDSGAALSAQEQALARFTIADLFAEPEIRKHIDPRLPDVADHDARLVGHLVLGAALYRAVAAKAGLPGRAMGELCRHGL